MSFDEDIRDLKFYYKTKQYKIAITIINDIKEKIMNESEVENEFFKK